MSQYTGEKTFEPTPRRRQEARKQGHVARSHDLVSALLLLLGLVLLMALGSGLLRFLGGYTAAQLGGDAWLSIDAASVQGHFAQTLGGLSRHVLPLFGLLVLGAVVAHLVQTGFLFLPEKIAPDVGRLNPIRGLGRLFSIGSTSRLGLGLLKVIVIIAVAGVDLYAKRDALLCLGAGSTAQIASFASGVLLWTSLKIGMALLVLGLLDYGVQRWRHERDLKMTTQEMREEMRDVEGNPELRARRRRVREQLAASRIAQAAAKADVVLAAPDGPAVAIRYAENSETVPIVVAKGDGPLAERIRRLAGPNGVPVVDRPRLAESLHREVELSRPIPRDHYAAVARILAQVYQQRGREMPDAA